jgi:hypothetical protein
MAVTSEKAGSNPVHLATLISGEDQTNDVIKTEQQFSYSRVLADTQIKSGSGFLHTLTFAPTDSSPTAGSITIYDSLSESGTAIFSYSVQNYGSPSTSYFTPFSVVLDVAFTTGLFVGFATTDDVGVTVSYR